MKNFVFFTLNNFQKEGGGTIRMLGIINELTKIEGTNVTLISPILNKGKVHSSVTHVEVPFEFSQKDKRQFQFLLGAFGVSIVNVVYKSELQQLEQVFRKFDKNTKYIFLEYLDNSMGYWLKMNKVIQGYVNDIHGIATHEFDFQAQRATSLKSKSFFWIKKKVSEKLDNKVFSNADGILYASKAMNEYFCDLYPSLKGKKNIYLPYVLNYQNIKAPDVDLVQLLKAKLNIKSSDFVYLFAGAFKEITGVEDLISSFDKVASRHKNCKLLLIGDGPNLERCQQLRDTLANKESIMLLGRQPYDYLTSFQELSHVLVCPDRQNLFSELIVHVKYLDALVSGKPVINGKFKSVMEINEGKDLSLLFKPSDSKDLEDQLEKALINYDELTKLYSSSKDYVLNNLTYTNYIQNLMN